MAELDPEVVVATFEACLTYEGDPEGVEVDMIVARATLSRKRLEDHSELIYEMLNELPIEFRSSTGGGWSFLNACNDRHGRQWTGLHRTMSMLFGMGEGLGLVDSLLPREMWEVLPGGVPYYVFKDQPTRSER